MKLTEIIAIGNFIIAIGNFFVNIIRLIGDILKNKGTKKDRS